LGLVIQYVNKQKAFHIAKEYDRKVLFLLLCAYKILNPTNEMKESKVILYPKVPNLQVCMMSWSDDDMAVSMVKERLIHFRIKKLNEEECKDPLVRWRTHKVHFPILVL
jgi:hypothetical protein